MECRTRADQASIHSAASAGAFGLGLPSGEEICQKKMETTENKTRHTSSKLESDDSLEGQKTYSASRSKRTCNQDRVTTCNDKRVPSMELLRYEYK